MTYNAVLRNLQNKSTILKKQFTSVLTEENELQIPPMNTSPCIDYFTIDTPCVEKFMKGIAPTPNTHIHKVDGPWNHYATELARCLTLILSKSLQQGKVRTDKKQTNVIPHCKKGYRTSATK
jgi:hypothetical protein